MADMNLSDKINVLQNELQLLVADKGTLVDPSVVRISQRLDILILNMQLSIMKRGSKRIARSAHSTTRLP